MGTLERESRRTIRKSRKKSHDVITTGGSVRKAIEAVEAEGCEVVKVIVIVDRNEGGSEQLIKEGYDFKAIINLPPSGEASISEPSAVTGKAK